ESDYAFDYSILPPLTDFTCPEELCYHCVYDLTMILEDACGQALATSEEMLGTYELDQNGVLSFITQIPCPSPADQIATMQVPALEPGDYKLIKKLELSTVARDLYLQDFLEQQLNCGGLDSATIAQNHLSAVIADCNVTCDECYAALGTLDDFILAEKGDAIAYEIQYDQCDELCKQESWCDIAYRNMLHDVSPGGQYGRLNVNGNVA